MTAEFVYLTLDQDPSGGQDRIDVPVTHCSTLEMLFDLPGEVMGILIDSADANAVESALVAIRSQPETAVKAVFVRAAVAGHANHLADGVADSVDSAYHQAAAIDARLQDLDSSHFSDRDAVMLRLLAFLYARPQASFEPVQHWSYPMLYRFPVVDAMVGAGEDGANWLDRMKQRSLLRHGPLTDRIRLCPSCDHAHLNYVDVCPNCAGIDIVQKPFLHCFTCGHVSPEEAFVEKGYLGCPNCKTRLRHIGADYDRALEAYSCNGCGHMFQEPEVTAHCQHCGTRSKPDDLLPHNVHPYDITEQGITAVKTGMIEDVYAMLDTLDNVNPAVFEAIMDWLLKLNLRHPDVSFGLIGVRLTNLLELTASIGRRRVSDLMDGFIARIRALLRTTDLTAHTSRRTLWILLPKTNAPGCDAVLERILDTQHHTHQDEGVALDINTVRFCAPQHILEGESASLLLARLG
jgi:hypothetical protein